MAALGAVQTTAFAAPDNERVRGGYADDHELETAARTATPETKYSFRPDASRAYPGDVVPAAPVQGTAKPERYLFDSCLRILHKGQRPFFLESANSPEWGMYA